MSVIIAIDGEIFIQDDWVNQRTMEALTMPHINLSTPEVLALQTGATEFVRPVKFKEPEHTPEGYKFVSESTNKILTFPWTAETIKKYVSCPYGQPGDVLACRETWGIDYYGGTMDDDGYGEWWYRIYYKFGGEKTVVFAGKCEEDPYVKHYDSQRGIFNSPVTMPLKFVRCRVRIVSVCAVDTATGWVWKIKHGGIES